MCAQRDKLQQWGRTQSGFETSILTAYYKNWFCSFYDPNLNNRIMQVISMTLDILAIVTLELLPHKVFRDWDQIMLFKLGDFGDLHFLQ